MNTKEKSELKSVIKRPTHLIITFAFTFHEEAEGVNLLEAKMYYTLKERHFKPLL